MFLAWKKSENESKNGSKITKKRFRATPHQRVEKNTLQTQKMNPKSWKTGGFFTFFWPGLAGAATNKSIPYCFLQCFVKASVTTYQKQEVFSKKCPPPQVNLNLSWLMPSGWSRPLHLRCGRIFPYIGNVIIPIDCHISHWGGPTTNQVCFWVFRPSCGFGQTGLRSTGNDPGLSTFLQASTDMHSAGTGFGTTRLDGLLFLNPSSNLAWRKMLHTSVWKWDISSKVPILTGQLMTGNQIGSTPNFVGTPSLKLFIIISSYSFYVTWTHILNVHLYPFPDGWCPGQMWCWSIWVIGMLKSGLKKRPLTACGAAFPGFDTI